MKSASISLIVPAFRQEKTILVDIRAKLRVLQKTGLRHELLVIVDGTEDKTQQKLADAHLPNVTCLQYQHNRGKAYAIRFGMRLARYQYVMFMDAGREIDPHGITMLLEHMQWYDADIIVGSKRHPVSQVHYSPARKILSWGYYWLVRLLFAVKVTDTQAGIKVFRRSVVRAIIPDLIENGFVGDLEMLLIARKHGYTRIFEAPIKLNYQLESVTSAATVRAVWQILIDTARLYLRHFRA